MILCYAVPNKTQSIDRDSTFQAVPKFGETVYHRFQFDDILENLVLIIH